MKDFFNHCFITSSIFLLLAINTCLKADYPLVPLVEKFASATSQESAVFNNEDGYNRYTLTEYRNDVSFVTYFVPNPKGDDIFYNFNKSMSDARSQYYMGDKIINPSVYLNGEKLLPSVDILKNKVQSQLSKRAPIEVKPVLKYDDNSKTARITVDINASAVVSGAKVHVLIMQSVASYNASNGEDEFFYIARYMLGGEDLDISAGGNKKFNYSQVIDEATIPLHTLYAVAFVQKTSDKKVIQSGFSHKIEVLEVQVSRIGSAYSIANLNETKQHSFNIKNVSAFPIGVKLYSFNAPDYWSYINHAEETIKIDPYSTVSQNYSIKCNTAKASSGLTGYSIYVTTYTPPDNTPRALILKKIDPVYFIDVTKSTKAVYLYGGSLSTSRSYEPDTVAFSKATLLKNEFTSVPFYDTTLFTTNFLDNFDFIGLTIDNIRRYALISYGDIILPKLTSLMAAKKKIYFGAEMQFAIANDSVVKKQYPKQCAEILNFYKNQFKVNNTSSTPYISFMPTETTVRLVKINGKKDDPIAKNKTYTINGGITENWQHYSLFSDFYTIEDTAKTTPIFMSPADNNAIIAVKYFNLADTTKRVLFGFDLQGLSKIGPVSECNEIANNIVDWLYAPPPVEEEEPDTTSITQYETNLFTKNGIKLFVDSNPVLSNLTLKIINENNELVNADLYLIDMLGHKVATINNSLPLQEGENYFSFSTTSIPNGKYFIVASTSRGKTVISIIVNT